MKKKILLSILLLLTIISVTGCKKKVEEKENDNGTEISSSVKGSLYLLLNTDGEGQISYYIDENNKVEFSDEYPKQQAYTKLEEETKVTIDAKADDGWKFEKWTKDGKKYSSDSKIDLTISEGTELTAVFIRE